MGGNETSKRGWPKGSGGLSSGRLVMMCFSWVLQFSWSAERGPPPLDTGELQASARPQPRFLTIIDNNLE